MRLLSPPGERALPLLAGGLLALAHPPVRLLLPAFVGLAPLLVFIAERPAGPGGRWAATRAGILTGSVYFGAQLYWLLIALLPPGPVGPAGGATVPGTAAAAMAAALAGLAFAGAVLVLAGLVGVFAWALHRLLERRALPLWLAAPILWVTLEWVQAHLGPFRFPWLGLGTALAPFPTLAGAADLVGARGLSAWPAAVNGLVAMALLEARGARAGLPPGIRPRFVPGVLLAALVVAAPAAYGALRAATLRLEPTATVAVLQTHVPRAMTAAARLETALAQLDSLTRAVGAGVGEGDRRVDLVVWPEVALPLVPEANPGAVGRVRDLARHAGAPILVGAYGTTPRGGRIAVHNSAFLVGPDGLRDFRYDKRVLVPFIERVPFRRASIPTTPPGPLLHYGTLTPGPEPPPAAIPGDPGTTAPPAVLICYESAFADLARRYRRDGAELLVNITNDAWYARDAWYGRTTAIHQHPAHLVLRAIETRTGIARAANAGIAMTIDPLGRVQPAGPPFRPAVTTATLHHAPGLTPFARLGDWLSPLAALATLALLIRTRHPHRPRPRTPPSDTHRAAGTRR